MGMLIRKISRQEPASISQPPRIGPKAAAMDDQAAQMPIARPRSALGKLPEISARLLGTKSAPPMPWTARAAISSPGPAARPHHSEAAANTAVPSANTRRRPKRSPAAPPISIRAARHSA